MPSLEKKRSTFAAHAQNSHSPTLQELPGASFALASAIQELTGSKARPKSSIRLLPPPSTFSSHSSTPTTHSHTPHPPTRSHTPPTPRVQLLPTQDAGEFLEAFARAVEFAYIRLDPAPLFMRAWPPRERRACCVVRSGTLRFSSERPGCHASLCHR